MNIAVRNSYPYKELIIESDNVKLSTGLISKHERIDLAQEFINAAYGLIYDDKEEVGSKLADILNECF